MKYKTAIVLAVLCVALGCDRARPRASDNVAKHVSRPKMERPEPYILNLSFTDHTGKQRTCFYEIKEDDREPSAVYQVKGVRPDGKEEYYYSLYLPRKSETGFLAIHEVSGKVIFVDFTSVVIQLIPCEHLPLDPTSKARKEYMNKWKDWLLSVDPYRGLT